MYEWMVARAQVLTTTGDKVFWSPGLQPVLLRGWALIVTTAVTAADPVTMSVDKRVTAGSDTGRVADIVGSITLPGGTVAGKVYYKRGFQAKISPGEELVFEVTDAAVAGNATIVILLEPSWEEPAQNTNMVASA
jgi:hypothetical protein